MKYSAPVAVLALGILVVCGAFLYGVLLVGVPTQDPSPMVAAGEAHVDRVSNGWISAGFILILIGASWLCICRLVRRRAKPARHGEASG